MEKKSFSIRACASYGWRTTFSNIGPSIGILLTFIGVQLALVIMFRGIIRLGFPVIMIPMIKEMMIKETMIKEMMTPEGLFSMVKSLFSIVKSRFSVLFLRTIIFAFIRASIVSGMYLGFIRIALDLYDKGTSKIMRFFSSFRFVLKDWLASAVVMAINLGVILIGLLLLIVIDDAMKLLSLTMPKIIMVVFVGILFAVTTPFIVLRTAFYTRYIVDKNAGPIESVLYSFRATKGLFWKVFGLSIVAGFSFITIIGIPAAFYMFTAAYRKLPRQTS